MTDAAFRACYAEWKVVKTRATVQIVLELPIEKADEAYQVLGGMPIAANEIWCAVARLAKGGDATERDTQSQQTETKPRPVQSPGSAGADKVKRKFNELPPAQQAGILCEQQSFKNFLSERCSVMWDLCKGDAAATVREVCQVNSRSELNKDDGLWRELKDAYELWKFEAEVVPA